MIQYKNREEIEIMAEGGKILAMVLNQVLDNLKPGVSEIELDQLAEKLILQEGAEPAFKRVSGYKHTLCISTNDVIVHGIPGDYKFKENDVVGIDCGVYFKGFNTDMARTQRVRIQSRFNRDKIQNSDEIDVFLQTGERALNEAIKVAKAGNRIGHISKTIQEIVEESGYSVVRSLVGHGVGKELHEEPEIPGFLTTSIEKTPLLKEGMTIAIEVIYNMGKKSTKYGEDGWTIKTIDGSLSGLFERTVAVTKKEPQILTA